ncbi:zinc-type alcohol dehydrogenase-like protein [Colletotrichum spaethianum]|uniref:Zinc-type alcohol dehydrogenase-like protein n=1 Tax=Colletotrichum spaethianum TaxID=700344 RepID=A0AA37L3C2_9PEZI|nr:zinc-type alcohol dehydrogenase-like protein [Colletotrichum spaethianum]GKT40966.1 zinc-type alcohol dehydrogenase-like protein [Colletotrichum spaethianum]
MATSRAWTFTARGSPRSVLSLTPRPAPTLPPAPSLLAKAKPVPNAEDGNEWLLVKVAYAALNPGGHFYVSMIPGFARAKTAVPEMDLSGTVTDVWGPGSEPGSAPRPNEPATTSRTTKGAPSTVAAATKHKGRFAKGDRVAAFIPISYGWPTGTGALAQHVVLPARYAVSVPPHISLRDGSSVLTAGCTAAMTLRPAALKKGDRVLVNGASGGVGSLAIQMARAAVGPEGYVVGVCSGRNLDMVRKLGADEVVDYTASSSPVSITLKEKFGREGKQFNAIVDCIGVQDIYTNCAGYLVPDGVYSAVGIKPVTQSWGGFMKAVWQMQKNALWPLSTWLGGTGRRWAATAMMDPGKELMEEVVGMLSDGRIKAVVGREVDFEEVADGYDIIGSGRARGKVVVKVDDE